MNPKTTWRWVLFAAVLLTASVLYHRFGPKKEVGPVEMLPGFNSTNVISVEILPANQGAITAVHTNGPWQLREPIRYPADAKAIQSLLTALRQTIPAVRISSQETGGPREADEKFGFNPPRSTIVIQPRDLHIQIGNKTAPGDQVFVKVVGLDGVFVVNADLLKLIPRAANDWRETALADLSNLDFDHLSVTNGSKAFQLARNPTNKLWRIIRPLNARADSQKIGEALTALEKLRTEQFVADGPKIDFDAYGLQSPALTLSFSQDTNFVLSLSFGKSPTNDPARVYARRNDEQTVVMVATNLLDVWHASYESLRDRQLVSPTGPLAAIEIHAQDTFTLHRTNQTWFVTPQNFVADTALVSDLLRAIGDMEIVQYNDVVVAPDLPALALAAPPYQIIFHEAVTNAGAITNLPVEQVDFGTNQNGLVFARRTDEGFVYSVKQSDFDRLPKAALELRDRRIWRFTENDVASITVQQNGKTLQLLRNGTNQWAVAAGSQGMIANEFALEETVHRFGELLADYWIQRGDQNRERFGFKPDDHRITFELKDGKKLTVELGSLASIGSPFALVTQENEPWVFTFPPVLYQFVQLYLTIPTGGP